MLRSVDIILRMRARNGKIISKVMAWSDFCKVLQGVKDRWAKNQNGGSFHRLALSLAETLANFFKVSELLFPHTYEKEIIEPAQPTSLDCGKQWLDMKGLWQLAVIFPSSARAKRKRG